MKSGKILKFSADWCNPCKIMKPIIEDIMSMDEFSNIELKEINVDEDYDLSNKYQIKNIPTLVLLDDKGNLLNKVIGTLPKNNLVSILKQNYNV